MADQAKTQQLNVTSLLDSNQKKNSDSTSRILQVRSEKFGVAKPNLSVLMVEPKT
jgi:hypothetical protein